jgi:glycosyltransferase involved in cell wall biosynthesis
MNRLRIAQVAPLIESVPPHGYGGTERVVSWLTEELVRRGHDVTLFASGDSRTNAKLVAPCKRALRLNGESEAASIYHLLEVERVARSASSFDLIHFHIDYCHFPVSQHMKCPHVTTLHGRLDLPVLQPLYRVFTDQPLISISDSQRRPLAGANWVGTVYHGLPVDLHTFGDKAENYLAFLGRISPEKGLDRAIRIAGRAGIKLKIAAKIDAVDREYYEATIAPMLKDHAANVEFLGELGGRRKDEFLDHATALLFPINWPEPFGLVMIEAMACGTPVVAFRAGSVPEIIEHGVTGFIVESEEEAVQAVNRIPELSRLRCRQTFEKSFTAARMAEDYEVIYQQLTGGAAREKKPPRAAASSIQDKKFPAALWSPAGDI